MFISVYILEARNPSISSQEPLGSVCACVLKNLEDQSSIQSTTQGWMGALLSIVLAT